MKIIIR